VARKPLHIQGGKIMIVQHNMTALNANRQLGVSNSSLAKSTEKLSSGYRINRAGDDAAGLSISEKMRGQIRGLNQASDNAQNGVSLIQTAEGALNETHAILQRMRELAVQGANDTNVTKDRQAINAEMKQLTAEIGRIGSTTEFNTMKLFSENSGIAATSKALQVGANADQTIKFQMAGLSTADGSTVEIKVGGLAANPSTVTLSAGVFSCTTNESYGDAIATLDTAIELVSRSRSDLGALQNRLEHTIANADNTSENLQSAESRIRDVDMADEMVKYSKSSILQQAGQSMLAQANQSTQGVLSLLR
jgi:flagellin